MPRRGRLACSRPVARKHRQSRAPGSCAWQRRLHSVPLAGPTVNQSDQRRVLRLARRLSAGEPTSRFLALRGAPVGRGDIHALARGLRAQESHAGERLRHERHVYERHQLLELPRHARHRERSRSHQACECHLLDLSWPEFAGRTARRDARGAQPAQRRESAMRRLSHAPDRADRSECKRSSHTFRFISPSMTEHYGIPNPCTSCHTDMTNESAAMELKNWGSISPWRVAP